MSKKFTEKIFYFIFFNDDFNIFKNKHISGDGKANIDIIL